MLNSFIPLNNHAPFRVRNDIICSKENRAFETRTWAASGLELGKQHYSSNFFDVGVQVYTNWRRAL